MLLALIPWCISSTFKSC